MSVLDDDFISYLSRWEKKKRLQIFIRAHLSHTLALLLAIAVLAREIPEIHEMVLHPSKVQTWHLFILSITVGTIMAAVWEFRGNKLATSPQEIRFVLGIRSLLTQLEKFKREIEKTTNVETFSLLNDFFAFFLKVTSNTLCGKKEVAGGLMLYQEKEGTLALHKYTPGAMYQEGLRIPLTGRVQNEEKGPAVKSFESGLIAYMPKKSKKIGIVLEAVHGERYKLVEIFKGWYKSQSEAEENFGAVLSIPVTIYAQEREKSNYGVLNYTTVKGDPFVPRDYIMSECFASILAQAIYAARVKLDNAEAVASLPPPDAPPVSEVVMQKAQPSQRTHSNYPQPKRNKKRKGKR
ncbi:MAG TPA: hypothetical protein VK363_14360 [Pyrinomonadaceae bacterium]|nr:hypothetical protein [Pyrinomonadaceae bacterium]